MRNLSLEEEILYRNVSPSLFDTKYFLGKSEVQYLEEGRDIISYFKNSLEQIKDERVDIIKYATSSESSFINFVGYLEESWKAYLRLTSKMNSFSENLNFLYPEKLKLFADLVETTFKLNLRLYLITDIEKEIYEKNLERLSEERFIPLVSSVKSFQVYLSQKIGEIEDLTNNPYLSRSLISDKPNLRRFQAIIGSSSDILGRVINDNKSIESENTSIDFNPKNNFEDSLKRIMAYDHFFEIFLRNSGILMNDLKFYVDLCQRISCKRNIQDLIYEIKKMYDNSLSKFNPRIPQYTQTELSCGATCLVNVIGTYYPYIKVTKSLEKGIHRLVTVDGFYNNLPSSLVYVSRDKFGIPAIFFSEFKTFAPLFLEQKSKQQPLQKFQEDYEKIKKYSLDYEKITVEEIRSKLKNGHFISYVTGNSRMLHYKMIVGYTIKDKGTEFYIFDPSFGTTKLPQSELLANMRNDKSFWGVEYLPPESVIFDETIEEINKAKELLKWKQK